MPRPSGATGRTAPSGAEIGWPRRCSSGVVRPASCGGRAFIAYQRPRRECDHSGRTSIRGAHAEYGEKKTARLAPGCEWQRGPHLVAVAVVPIVVVVSGPVEPERSRWAVVISAVSRRRVVVAIGRWGRRLFMIVATAKCDCGDP